VFIVRWITTSLRIGVNKVALLHTRGIFTEPYTYTPIKFREHVLPEFFTCTAYLVDNHTTKVTNDVEVVRAIILGSRSFNGHIVYTSKYFSPTAYGALQSRHYDLAKENRSRLMAYAVQVAIQSNIYKKSKDGGHTWQLGGRKDVTEAELKAISKSVTNSAYEVLDDAFYKDFAQKYLQAEKETGRPIAELYDSAYPGKSRQTIQRWATTARQKGFLPKTKPGKASSSTTRKKGK
jgi:hypothetical protein